MKIGMILELLSARRRLRVRERWTRQQLESYQTEALRRLRQYAYAHSRFYLAQAPEAFRFSGNVIANQSE